MSDFVSGFLGSIIGAAAAVASGLLIENYKYHRGRCAAASAIAGELFAIIDMTARCGHVNWFTSILKQLNNGNDVQIPSIIGQNEQGRLDPVIEAHLGQLGFLGGHHLPERISLFYTYLAGIRTDLTNLASNNLSKESKIGIIEEDLNLWATTEALGKQLHSELSRIAAESWWLTKVYNDLRQILKKIQHQLPVRETIAEERTGTKKGWD